MEQGWKILIDDVIAESEIETFHEQLKSDTLKFAKAFISKFLIWGPVEQPQTVEGSVVRPIDNPGQLIEGPDAK